MRTLMPTLARCFSIACLVSLVTLADAATYKYTDSSGNTIYSASPPTDGSKYETIRTPASRGGADDSAPATGSSSGGGSSGSTGGGNAKDLIKNEMAKNQEIRQKNCEAAKKNLEAYTVYRRVQDKDGNVTVLDDNERAKKIEESQKAVEQFCE